MVRSKVRIAVFFCFAILAGVQFCPGQAVKLEQKWQTGKRYVQQITVNTEQNLSMPNMPQPINQTMNQVQKVSLTVLKKRPQGGYVIEYETLSIKMENQTMAGAMSFDSDSDPANDAGNPIAPMMRKLAGSKLKYFLDANGEVENIEGLEAFENPMFAGYYWPKRPPSRDRNVP